MFLSLGMFQGSPDLGGQLGVGITAHSDGAGWTLGRADPAAPAEFSFDFGHSLLTHKNSPEWTISHAIET
jgi:hypothetical protein